MVRKKLIVNKLPLSPEEKFDRHPNFKRTPRLYLELIENKDKIKQNLVNTEYNPDNANSPSNSVISDDNSVNYEMRTPDIKNKHMTIGNSKYSDEEDNLDSNYNSENEVSDDGDENDSDKDDSDVGSDDGSDADSDDEEKYKKSYSPSENSDYSNVSDESDLSDRLKNLLSDEPTKKSSKARYSSSSTSEDDDDSSVASIDYNKFSNKRSAHNYYRNSPKHHAPTLSELENKGEIKTSDYMPEASRTEQTELDDEDLKREMLFKFELLKKSYKDSNIDIPEFTIHSDYKTMERSYQNSIRRLSLDSTVDSYKTYMIYGFMGVEFVLGHLFKFDMQGFTQHQLSNMGSYERLLIELGEKSYVPGGSDWPVEVRLLGMILLNAAFFLITKMMTKKTGENVMGMMNSFNNLNKQTSRPEKKKSMRGPDIDSDLEELSD
jgi:hypothetical protein